MSARSQAAEKLRNYLLRRGLPRIQMTVIVVGTGLAGFGASVALLSLGVSSMAVRYLIAVLLAYASFLFFVRLWIAYQRRQLELDVDAIDLIPDSVSTQAVPRTPESLGGDGGEFGGGGAGGSWESVPPTPATAGIPAHGPVATSPDADAVAGAGSSAGGEFDLPDPDEGWVLVVPFLLLLGGLFAALYVVYVAPVLLAEVLLDVLLVSGLYRRLRKLEPQSWLSTAVRRTWVPVTVVAALVTAAGFTMQRLVPQANSIGDVLALFSQ